jgi:tetratricopeptide (TPR) repeat protein
MLNKKIRTVPIMMVVVVCVLTIDFSAFGQKKKDNANSSRKEEYNQIESSDKFTEGVKYYILEDMAKALMLFQKSLEYDPDNDAAYYQIAKILSEKGEYGEALNYASKALGLNPQNKYYYLINAEILTRQSNFKAASELYETMLREVEGTDEYLFDLAALYLYQEEFEKAIDAYVKAEAVFGLVPEIVYQKQKIYLKLNKLDKAIEEGIALIEYFPG